MEVQTQDCVLTELDYARLASLSVAAAKDLRAANHGLDELLEDADVVSPRGVAADIVTMNSQVRLRTVEDGVEQRLTLCYPADAEPAAGKVSILSPLALALLGRTVGTMVRWKCPDGSERTAEIEEIVFQPEASGDFVT